MCVPNTAMNLNQLIEELNTLLELSDADLQTLPQQKPGDYIFDLQHRIFSASQSPEQLNILATFLNSSLDKERQGLFITHIIKPKSPLKPPTNVQGWQIFLSKVATTATLDVKSLKEANAEIDCKQKEEVRHASTITIKPPASPPPNSSSSLISTPAAPLLTDSLSLSPSTPPTSSTTLSSLPPSTPPLSTPSSFIIPHYSLRSTLTVTDPTYSPPETPASTPTASPIALEGKRHLQPAIPAEKFETRGDRRPLRLQEIKEVEERQYVNPNALDTQGYAPIHRLALENNLPKLRALLRQPGLNIDIGTSKGNYTALHITALQGYAEMTALLLSHGANPLRRSTEGNYDAKCFALIGGHTILAETIHSKYASTQQQKEATRDGKAYRVSAVERDHDHKQQEEIGRIRRQQQEAESARKQQEEIEKARKQQEEAERIRKQQEEAEKIRKQQEEAERIRKQQEEAEKIRKQQEEAERIRKQQEEAERIRKQQEEAERIRKQQEEAEKIRKQQEEAERIRKQQEEAERIRKEQEEAAALALQQQQAAIAAANEYEERKRRVHAECDRIGF